MVLSSVKATVTGSTDFASLFLECKNPSIPILLFQHDEGLPSIQPCVSWFYGWYPWPYSSWARSWHHDDEPSDWTGWKTGRVWEFFRHLGLSSIDDLEFIATSHELSLYLEQQFLHQNSLTSLSAVEIQKLLRLFNIIAEMDEVTIPAIRNLTVLVLKSARRHTSIPTSNDEDQEHVPD